MNCPTCDREMEHIEAEPDVGITGGWYCSTCDEDHGDGDTADPFHDPGDSKADHDHKARKSES